MVQRNGVIARVFVDDGDLPEYGVNFDEESKTLSCWIPSEAGEVRLPSAPVRTQTNNRSQEFNIGVRRIALNYDSVNRFFVDGNRVEGRFRWKNQGNRESVCTGFRNTLDSEQPLVFSHSQMSGKQIHSRSQFFL